jgi:hypothetical protein
VILSAATTSTAAAIVDALAADQAETCYRSQVCPGCARATFSLPRLGTGNVFLWVCDYDAVDDCALFAGQACARRRLAHCGGGSAVLGL